MKQSQYRFVVALSLIALALGGHAASKSIAEEIRWQRDANQVAQSARLNGKPIMVFVTAQWCHYCQKMKQETLRDPRLATAISRSFETLLVDGDRDSELVSRMGVKGFPTTLLYSQEGTLVAQKSGYMSPVEMDSWLRSTTH